MARGSSTTGRVGFGLSSPSGTARITYERPTPGRPAPLSRRSDRGTCRPGNARGRHHHSPGRVRRPPRPRFLDDSHPNAPYLDLFGAGSLFELLCTARTRKGEDTLAAWLRTPAGPGEVRERQAAVEDLRQRLDLREDLALLGADVPA